MKIIYIFLISFISILSINLGSSESSISYSAPEEYLCLITFNYLRDHGLNYSYIENKLGSYSSDTFKEYLDNWQYYCSDMVGRSLKEEVICSRAYTLLENNKGVYTLTEVNALREGLLPHLKISNNLLEKYIKNYGAMCLFNNKPLSFTKGQSDRLPEKKLTNIVIFFIILFSIILFGLYMSIRGNGKEKS